MRSFPKPVTRPSVPLAAPVSDALSRCGPLVQLQRQIAQSQARWNTVRPALPLGLQRHVQPGPLEEGTWYLLTDNAAVASKLRHWLPKLEDSLRRQGDSEMLRMEVRVVPKLGLGHPA